MKLPDTENSTSSTSTKEAPATQNSAQGQVSDSSESEKSEDSDPGYWDDGSRSVSLYSPSNGPDVEDDPPPNSPNRLNIINEYMNEDSKSETESTASFHDDSSYLSSIDDQLMPDLYDSSDESEDEDGSDSDSEEVEDEP
jgi:hypothetical protein